MFITCVLYTSLLNEEHLTGPLMSVTSFITLVQKWPWTILLQQWPRIPSLHLRFPWLPRLHHRLSCGIKNTFGILMYVKVPVSFLFLLLLLLLQRRYNLMDWYQVYCYYYGVGAHDDPFTVTISELLCIPISFLISPDCALEPFGSYQQRLLTFTDFSHTNASLFQPHNPLHCAVPSHVPCVPPLNEALKPCCNSVSLWWIFHTHCSELSLHDIVRSWLIKPHKNARVPHHRKTPWLLTDRSCMWSLSVACGDWNVIYTTWMRTWW
jgi:hypothetical protein